MKDNGNFIPIAMLIDHSVAFLLPFRFASLLNLLKMFTSTVLAMICGTMSGCLGYMIYEGVFCICIFFFHRRLCLMVDWLYC